MVSPYADEIRAWNAANGRARVEYRRHPTACADWCVRCVNPVGSTPDCETCKATRRMRRLNKETP